MMQRPSSGIFLGLISLDILSTTKFPIPRNKKFRNLPITLDTGGPAANAARAFSALGGNARFVSFGDTTPVAKVLWAMYRQENPLIDIHREEATGEPTIANTLIAEDTGERSILANGQPSVTNSELESQLTASIDIALLDGYHFKHFLPLLEKLRADGTYIVLDGGSWKDDVGEYLNFIDCAILSNDFEVPSKENPAEFLQRRGVETIIITNGENAIQVCDGKEKWSIIPPEKRAVDTLGAGDMFHGAFCFYYSQHGDLNLAVKAAAKFASDSVTYFGLRAFFGSREQC